MAEVLSAPAGASLWLDVTFGLFLAVSLILAAEVLARYVAEPRKLTRSHSRQSPAPSGTGLSNAELLSQL
jgi:hypothetical protein